MRIKKRFLIWLTFTIFLQLTGLIFLKAPSQAAVSLPYYEDFEKYTSDADMDDGPCNGIDSFPLNNCNVKVRNAIPARYGSKYLTLECSYSGNCADRNLTLRSDTVFGGFRGDNGTTCHIMYTNDGTHYWMGWSHYIPEGYTAEYFSHNVAQIMAPNITKYIEWAPGQSISIGQHRYYGYQIYLAATSGTTGSMAPTHLSGTISDGGVSWTYYRSKRELIWNLHYGGDAAHGRENFEGRHKWTDNANGADIYPEYLADWGAYRGKWVDVVLHVRWYETDNANAVFHLWLNGNLVYGTARDGLRNIPTDRKPQLYPVQCYNPAYSSSNSCTDFIKQYNIPHQRIAFLDEFRFTDTNVGYCGVSPPIWAVAPLISFPVNGSTNVGTSFAIQYGAYVDHREDLNNCFSRSSTQIQIDEQGGDWSSLVYETHSAGETSHVLNGLASGRSYQMRVRHKSIRAGNNDIYSGEWSPVVNFRTGASLLGDLNYDGKVDIADYSMFIQDFGKTGANLPADLNKNGQVEIGDYSIFISNFGKTS